VSKVTLTAPGAKKLVLTIRVVPKGATVKATKAAITSKVKTLRIGQSKTLKVKLTPARTTKATATWKSTRPKIASVDAAGRITGLTKGTTVIVAKVGGKTTQETITVK
jgi:uncharacterized protein YjdB